MSSHQKAALLIWGMSANSNGPRVTKWLVRHALFLAWLLGMCLASGSVGAQDHITQRAWLDDPSGALQWPQVAQQPARPFEGVLSRGFGDSAIWVRLRIDPHAQPASRNPSDTLILRIRPVYLDDVQVFDPLADGLVGVAGDLQHPREQIFKGLDFMLPIARGDVPRDIWLRLKSTSTRQISLQVCSQQDLQRLTQNQHLVYSLYIGLILILIVWGVVHWLFSREKVIGVFGLKQVAALAYALCSLGFARIFWPVDWPPEWLDHLTSVCGILAVSAGIFFHVVLITEFDPPPWLLHVLRGFGMLLPIKLLLLVASQPMVALRINMLEMLLTPPIFLLSVLLARGWSTENPTKNPLLPQTVVVCFYALVIFILALASLPALGLVRGGEIPLYVVQAHGLVTAFLILLLLQYRAHVRQELQRNTVLALERTQLQANQERQIREEQSNLLAMLAHEIKTLLATMHMRLDGKAQGSKEIRRAIREMNAVIERCLQTAQFSDSQLKANAEPVNLVQLVQEVVSSIPQPERVQLHLPAQWTALTDPQLLYIVLTNLLENACKYSELNSPIVLTLQAIEGEDGLKKQACFKVSNRPGVAGWPAPDKVFEKYYRSPHARRQAGSGLGLFLVRNLVQVLGGRIQYAPDTRNIHFLLLLPV